jgi:hypothetical protein
LAALRLAALRLAALLGLAAEGYQHVGDGC